jgi:Animal haem peroxidase
MGLFSRAFIGVTSALDRRFGWDRLPPLVGLFVLDGIRMCLRRDNLFDVGLPRDTTGPCIRDRRTRDGSWNDVDEPRAGSIGTRFGRNSPRTYWFRETDATLFDPSPREVSLDLLTRKSFVPARSLNVLAAAWIQFEVHDWLHHIPDDQAPPFRLPLRPDDRWPQDPSDPDPTPAMKIKRTLADPSSVQPGAPPFFKTDASHWWDGSQVYGSTPELENALREPDGGRLKLPGGLPPKDLPLDRNGVAGNLWAGLGALEVLFMREHNEICKYLAKAYTGWDNDRLYHTARLVNAAVMAKIHTVEWTPAIVAHPTTVMGMNASWYGLLGKRARKVIGRVGHGDLLSGIPGSRTEHFAAPYSLTEEFVAVYRMHPLIPDDYVFRSVADPAATTPYTFPDLLGPEKTLDRLQQHGVDNVLYSLGVSYPGALVLDNYPKALQDLTRPNHEHLDLAAVDIMRIRESAVPRYNEFRRIFHLKPAESFEDVTCETANAGRLRALYGEIEKLDLMVGLFAEARPVGFGFSDTAFRVFLLMASRRLKSDRFFTADYTPDMYTREGLEWVEKASMVSVLRRNYPSLEPVLRGVENAFVPWDGGVLATAS